jgi:DnaJ-class molecular chaperone
MEIVMDDNCPDCDGTGFGNMNEACRDEPCKTCNGTGKYHTRSVGGAAESIGNCPTCNGTGKVFDDTVPEPQTTMATHKPCPDCVGKVPAIVC